MRLQTSTRIWAHTSISRLPYWLTSATLISSILRVKILVLIKLITLYQPRLPMFFCFSMITSPHNFIWLHFINSLSLLPKSMDYWKIRIQLQILKNVFTFVYALNWYKFRNLHNIHALDTFYYIIEWLVNQCIIFWVVKCSSFTKKLYEKINLNYTIKDFTSNPSD